MTDAPLPSAGLEVIRTLYDIIGERRCADTATSYTSRLFSKGRVKIVNKVGEEAVELVTAALVQGPEEVVSESADLLYHLLVLWVDAGVTPDQICGELERRFGTSGLKEKASRSKTPKQDSPA